MSALPARRKRSVTSRSVKQRLSTRLEAWKSASPRTAHTSTERGDRHPSLPWVGADEHIRLGSEGQKWVMRVFRCPGEKRVAGSSEQVPTEMVRHADRRPRSVWNREPRGFGVRLSVSPLAGFP